jgi:hypothetical protein
MLLLLLWMCSFFDTVSGFWLRASDGWTHSQGFVWELHLKTMTKGEMKTNEEKLIYQL